MLFTIQRNLPCIIVDGSYYTFYRYFATLRWYQFKDPDVIIEDIHCNDSFIKSFTKHLHDEMDTICKRWNTIKSNIIFCRDCPRDNIWRHEHIDAYKGTRLQNAKFNPNIFRNVYGWLGDNNYNIVSIEKLEADDVAAMTKCALREKGFDNEIVFITNDNDYLQLRDENTQAFNLHEKDGNLSKRSTGDAMKDLRIKILMGDKSDNIPPVYPRMGAKTALKLAEMQDDELKVHVLAKGGETSWFNFERNRKIIDLSLMCESFQSLFNDSTISFPATDL